MSFDKNNPNTFIRIFNKVWANIYGKWATILIVLAIILIVLRAAGITNVVLAVLITLVPLLLAVTISWMLNPLVWRLIKKTSIKPKSARIIVFLSFIIILFSIVGLLIWLFVSQFGIFVVDMLGKRDIAQIHKYLLEGNIGGLAKFKASQSGSILFDNKQLSDWWIKEIETKMNLNTNIVDEATFTNWLKDNVKYLSTDSTIREWNNQLSQTHSADWWKVVNNYVNQLHYSDIGSLNFKFLSDNNGIITYHYTTSNLQTPTNILISIPVEFTEELRLGSSYHFLLRLLTGNWINNLGSGWVVYLFNSEMEYTDFSQWLSKSFTIIKVILAIGFAILITIFITWYLIGKFEKISVWLTKNLPTTDADKRFIIAKSVHGSIFGWLKGLAIDELFILVSVTSLALIAGSTGGSGMLIKTCIIFGLFAALMNLIPFLGPILGGIPILIASIMEMGNSGTWGPMITVIIGLIVIQIIEGIWLVPLAYSKQTDLHPVVVLLGVTVFGAIFGLWGMPFAVPVLAMIKSISINAYNWTPFSITGAEIHTHRQISKQRNE